MENTLEKDKRPMVATLSIPRLKTKKTRKKRSENNRRTDPKILNDDRSTNASILVASSNKRYQAEALTTYGFNLKTTDSFASDKSFAGYIVDDQNTLCNIEFRARKIGMDSYQCRLSNLSIENQQRLARYLNEQSNPGVRGDSLNQLSYDQIADGAEAKIASHSVASDSGANAPVDKIMDEPSNTKKGARKSTLVLAALALIAAIIAIFILVTLFVQARNKVKIDNAALVGNYLPIQSSAEGLITGLEFFDGQAVKAGDVLFTVQNKELETEVAFAQAEIEQANVEVEVLEKLIFDYHGKLELVAESIAQRILMAKADLRQAQLQSQSQKTLLNSKRNLLNNNVISQLEFDQSQSQLEIMQADIQAKQAQVGILEVDYKAATEKGILSMGDILEDQLGQLKSELTLSQAKKSRAVANLEAISQNLIEVQAPTDGRIYAVYRKKGEFVKLAEPILSISQNDHYWASGSVDSEEAHRIRPGQKVEVKISSLDIVVTGEVAAVGHRAVYTQGGWSQDFRGAGLAVPVKVTLPSLPADVPSGLRMKMVVNLGFKWPWENGENAIWSAHANVPDYSSVEPAIENNQSKTLEIEPISTRLQSVSVNWDRKLASELTSRLQHVPGVRVYNEKSGVVNVRINSNEGFRSGSNTLARRDKMAIAAIGIALRDYHDVHIDIEGHTDSVSPSPTERYATNKSLSLARAQSAQQVLESEVGIPKYRLSAIGLADSKPISSNATVIGRQQNRRVELKLKKRFERVPDQASLNDERQ